MIASFMPYYHGLSLFALSNLPHPLTPCSFSPLSAFCLRILTLGISLLSVFSLRILNSDFGLLCSEFSHLHSDPCPGFWLQPSAPLPCGLISAIWDCTLAFCISALCADFSNLQLHSGLFLGFQFGSFASLPCVLISASKIISSLSLYSLSFSTLCTYDLYVNLWVWIFNLRLLVVKFCDLSVIFVICAALCIYVMYV